MADDECELLSEHNSHLWDICGFTMLLLHCKATSFQFALNNWQQHGSSNVHVFFFNDLMHLLVAFVMTLNANWALSGAFGVKCPLFANPAHCTDPSFAHAFFLVLGFNFQQQPIHQIIKGILVSWGWRLWWDLFCRRFLLSIHVCAESRWRVFWNDRYIFCDVSFCRTPFVVRRETEGNHAVSHSHPVGERSASDHSARQFYCCCERREHYGNLPFAFWIAGSHPSSSSSSTCRTLSASSQFLAM